MQYLILPLSIFALAFVFHGFPDIKIGGNHEYHEHNYIGKDEEDDK